jgi:alpha 1,3-glucosidase
VARIVMDEVDGLRQRYNEAANWAIQSQPELALDDGDFVVDIGKKKTSVKYAGGRHEVRIEHKPVKITFFRDGQPHVVVNERGLLNMEHFRVKTVGEQPEEVVVEDPSHPGEQRVIVKEEAFPGFLPENEDGMWEETFNGKKDTKPKGASSVIVALGSCQLIRCEHQVLNRFLSILLSPVTNTYTVFLNTHRRSV